MSGIILCLVLLQSLLTSQDDAAAWGRQYGYDSGQVHAVSIERRMPFVDVEVNESKVHMLFDTGNMSRLVIDSGIAKELGLRIVDTVNRLDAAGNVVDESHVYEASSVRALGIELQQHKMFSRDEYHLKGLLGPAFLAEGRFTLDYESGFIGIGPSVFDGDSPFEQIPLVLSEHYVGLIVLRGRINGREVLIELDTGKSRSVIDPVLVKELGLEEDENGVPVNSVEIGSYQFSVPSAKVLSFSGISQAFPEPILFGIGADILPNLVFTVDYPRGVFVIHKLHE